MSWLFLFLAGLFEAGWLISIEKSDSFSKPQFVFVAVLSMAISLYLFALSLDNISVTVAYLVWLAVGALSILIIHHFFIGPPISTKQIFFMCLIFIGIIGIKFCN